MDDPNQVIKNESPFSNCDAPQKFAGANLDNLKMINDV